MDDDVRRGQCGTTLVVQAEAILAHIARDGSQPAGHLIGKPRAELGPQAVEAVVLDHLAGQAGGGGGPAARADQHDDFGLGDAAQDAFDQRSAQKPGGTGNEKTLGVEVPADGHRECLAWSAESVYHLVSADRSDAGQEGADGGGGG